MTMNNLKEKTNYYANEKVVDVLKETFAKVYSDGYKEGYNDCESETEYIDLGLPSGTLWATDYERKYGEILYVRYTKAFLSDIPTTEQLRELISKCSWDFEGHQEEGKRHLVCKGPNGKRIHFFQTVFPSDKENYVPVNFWINDTKRELPRNVVFMDFKYVKPDLKFYFEQKEVDEEYRLPIRLVRNK